MENATKALLIAAAVLVAILIISLGLVVYNMAADTVQSVNISDTEIQAHNDKFIRYQGTSQRGTTVNAMITQTMSYNASQTDEGRKVTIYYNKDGKDPNTEEGSSDVYLAPGATTSPARLDTGKTYTVQAITDTDSGLITKITIKQNKTTAPKD